jgi:hypothetical protein
MNEGRKEGKSERGRKGERYRRTKEGTLKGKEEK